MENPVGKTISGVVIYQCTMCMSRRRQQKSSIMSHIPTIFNPPPRHIFMQLRCGFDVDCGFCPKDLLVLIVPYGLAIISRVWKVLTQVVSISNSSSSWKLGL
jgi:hypothetical protein